MQFSSLPFFPQIRQSIQTLAITNNVDSTHGLAHALKVGSLTLKALEYQEVSAQEHQDIAYAALLHDVDDHKYFKTVDFANAVATLQSLPLPPPRLQKVISIIQLVSFSKNGNQIKPQIPLAFYLPRYIDRSEAIGLEGLYRSYLYNRQKQHPDPIYNADTPRPTCQEDLESMSLGRDKAYMERGGRSATVVDHFFDKLFHIRLPAQLANPELLRLYRAKHQEMVEFLLRHAKDGYLHYEQELLAEGKLRANEWGTHP